MTSWLAASDQVGPYSTYAIGWPFRSICVPAPVPSSTIMRGQ
jgi:hypothetical protein